MNVLEKFLKRTPRNYEVLKKEIKNMQNKDCIIIGIDLAESGDYMYDSSTGKTTQNKGGKQMQLNFHCLFEQSGTFKNVFKEFGHNALDYDILNDYGQTDFQIDLFKEIETEYDNIVQGGVEQTIFTDMQPNKDFIFAFFPCTYFSDLNELQFRLIKSRSEPVFDKPNIERVLQRNKDRAYFYEIWIKFCFICHTLNIPTIIENPVGNNRRNYLKLYSPFQPSWTDEDRTKFGDKFRKPTHYFAINFEMKEDFQMYDKEYFGLKTIQNCKGKDRQRERSEITPRYARNFYKRFIEKYVENLKEVIK